MLFDWLVIGHVLEVNPAHAVRGPKYVVKKGKTPVLTAEEARELLDSIPIVIRLNLSLKRAAFRLCDPLLLRQHCRTVALALRLSGTSPRPDAQLTDGASHSQAALRAFVGRARVDIIRRRGVHGLAPCPAWHFQSVDARRWARFTAARSRRAVNSAVFRPGPSQINSVASTCHCFPRANLIRQSPARATAALSSSHSLLTAQTRNSCPPGSAIGPDTG